MAAPRGGNSRTVSFSVNGRPVKLAAQPRRTLLDSLRDDLGLTGTKRGCDGGECWSCAVLLDDKVVASCRLPLEKAGGRSVVTIEGLATEDGLDPVQTAFVEAGAVQCGFCTPGLVISTKALLQRNPSPTREQVVRALSKHICRCTGYAKIIDAVLLASEVRAGSREPVTQPGIVGKSLPRVDAWSKVSGAVKYGADISMDGQLFARVLRSKLPHALVLGIDKSAALAMPGVEAVFTASDFPGTNRIGYVLRDQPALVGDKVRRAGDPVAMVVATSDASANAALGKIKVDYEPLDAVLDPAAALAEDAPTVHEHGNLLCRRYVAQGDVELALRTADILVEGTYVTPFAEHAYLEPEAGLAYLDDDGRVVIHSCTQNPELVQEDVAYSLGLDPERVRSIPTAIGGAFGGKLDATLEVQLALAAYKLQRPVKMVYSRSESFLASTKKHPFRINLRLGATKAGKLVALQGRLLGDGGAYASASIRVLSKAVIQSAGCYGITNVFLEGVIAYTNNPPTGPMRGYGANQACYAIESLMDVLAHKLKIDPLKLRTMNVVNKGSTTITGHTIRHDAAVRKTLEGIVPYYEEARRWRERKPDRAGLVRGVGVACYSEGLGPLLRDPGEGFVTAEPMTERGVSGHAITEAEAELLPDGRICVYTGSVELGQGATTALTQIAAEEMRLSPEQIVIVSGDTALTPPAGSTSASRTTFRTGYAVRSACGQLAEVICASAATPLGRPQGELVLSEGFVFKKDEPTNRMSLADVARGAGQSLRARGVQAHSDDPLFGPSGHSASAQLAQVEVDTRSGNVRVVRLVSVQDAGKAINPLAVEGQIEGGLVMGLGLALKEEFRPGQTSGFREYQVPRTGDMPEIVPVIIEVPDENGPFGAKGMGEHTLVPTIPAITNAITDATGVRICKIPVEKDALIGKRRARRQKA